MPAGKPLLSTVAVSALGGSAEIALKDCCVDNLSKQHHYTY